MIILPVASLVLLVVCWVFGDIEIQSKLIFTALVGLCWCLWLMPDLWGLSVIGFFILDPLLWFVTFGPSRSGRV
jgi:hypothetical protein